MHPETEIKWLFLDLNSYFASVEQQENPALRGKPVVVMPVATDYTCAIAASYEAKKYGIKTGTPIHEAKAKCPGLTCVLARHDKYVAYHHKILDEVIKHTPINKVWSIDELSSRLPPGRRNIEAVAEISAKLKAGLRKNVGEAITCSIGVAQNSLLAKLASDMQKPDGFTVLTPENVRERLFGLKLRDLPGINHGMEARLAAARIHTVEKLYNLSPKHARKIWGSVAGERFWYQLHGYDLPEQETERSMIGHSRVLDIDARKPEAAMQIARRLTVKAAARLRAQDFHAASFMLSVRDPDYKGWNAVRTFTPAQDNFTFLAELDVMWRQMLQEFRPLRLKKVSVTFHDLCKKEEITPDLFDFASEARQKQGRKSAALTQSMDTLNRKYGAEIISVGISPRTNAGYVGTKIAFSRVPDMTEFHQ